MQDARLTLAHAHAHDQSSIALTDCVISVNLLDAMTGSVSIAGGTLAAEYVRAERNGRATFTNLAVRAHWVTADQYGAVSVDGATVDADRLVAQGNGTLTLRRARTIAGAAEAFTATLSIDGGRIEVDQLNARDDGRVITNGADVRVGRVEATRGSIEFAGGRVDADEVRVSDGSLTVTADAFTADHVTSFGGGTIDIRSPRFTIAGNVMAGPGSTVRLRCRGFLMAASVLRRVGGGRQFSRLIGTCADGTPLDLDLTLSGGGLVLVGADGTERRVSDAGLGTAGVVSPPPPARWQTAALPLEARLSGPPLGVIVLLLVFVRRAATTSFLRRRWALTALAGVSLAGGVATALLWQRGNHHTDAWLHHRDGTLHELQLGDGGIRWWSGRNVAAGDPVACLYCHRVTSATSGRVFVRPLLRPSADEAVIVPYWLVGVASLVIPVYWCLAAVRSRRGRERGVCVGCGYDLRASPTRCPECGLVAG